MGLFMQTGKTEAAQRMQRCTALFFAMLEGRVSNDAAVKGTACICWQCGHCGIERAEACAGAGPRVCKQCGESVHTNYIRVVTNDNQLVPWQEIGEPTAVITTAESEAE